jgi:hypothetical protein
MACSRSSRISKELLNAALGRGDYAEQLKPRERLQAVIKALEWGIGRPIPQVPSAGELPQDDDVGLIIS